MTIRITYDDTVKLHCTDNSKIIDAEVLDFNPRHVLTVSVQRAIKLILKYNAAGDNYVGSMAGMEFTTQGPKETQSYTGRQFK
jgi:hypothetical protein